MTTAGFAFAEQQTRRWVNLILLKSDAIVPVGQL